MLYNKYYNEDIEWIKTKITEGKNSLNSSTKLYSGLFADFFKPEELITTIQKSVNAGADGVSLFAYHKMIDAHWKFLSEHELKNKL